MFHKKTDDIKPCAVMRPLISGWIDNKLSFITLRFTELHVAHCPRCGDAVQTLRAMTRRLKGLSDASADRLTLTDERWSALQASLTRVDEQRAEARAGE